MLGPISAYALPPPSPFQLPSPNALLQPPARLRAHGHFHIRAPALTRSVLKLSPTLLMPSPRTPCRLGHTLRSTSFRYLWTVRHPKLLWMSAASGSYKSCFSGELPSTKRHGCGWDAAAASSPTTPRAAHRQETHYAFATVETKERIVSRNEAQRSNWVPHSQ